MLVVVTSGLHVLTAFSFGAHPISCGSALAASRSTWTRLPFCNVQYVWCFARFAPPNLCIPPPEGGPCAPALASPPSGRSGRRLGLASSGESRRVRFRMDSLGSKFAVSIDSILFMVHLIPVLGPPLGALGPLLGFEGVVGPPLVAGLTALAPLAQSVKP